MEPRADTFPNKNSRYKCWKLTGWGVAGAAVYCAAFIARAFGAADYKDLTTYVVHFNFVYAAPPLFELLNYGVLARVAYYLPYHCPIHPGRLKTTFTALATVIEALGGYGAYYVSKRSEPESEQAIGRGCLAASLFLQVAVLLVFVALAAVFHSRARRARTPRGSAGPNAILWTLYASSLLILARTVFRLVEFFGLAAFKPGEAGFDPSSVAAVVRFEWPFYVFEASFMLCNHLLLGVLHPRRHLPEDNAVYLAQDGVTELEGPGFKDDRNWCLILMDPFDVIGLVKGTNKSMKFWQGNGFSELREPIAGDRTTRVRHHERRKR
ncbi:rta1 domain protein [Colletotrichum incanum]|uniref:Rta1 domain protein n=1 Tax=Colletotrichum incanum TaxID=1573173 RepID=A0A167BS95_COLIC|nr:rta1 domain protein [Colletotrichum incanum]